MVRVIAVILLAIFFLFGGYNFKDIGEAIVYYGKVISSSHPTFGSIIFIMIILLILFTDNFIGWFKKGKKAGKRIKPKF